MKSAGPTASSRSRAYDLADRWAHGTGPAPRTYAILREPVTPPARAALDVPRSVANGRASTSGDTQSSPDSRLLQISAREP
jgi:hypothetical protein